MNKTAIKNFAIWARVTLMEAVAQRAYEYEITEHGTNDPNADIIAGRPLTAQEKQQRRELISRMEEKGFQNTMEEAAYTWFNRFIALRYMEVNGYLPSRVRVFTNEMGEFKPEILKEAMTLDLPGLNREEILSLLEKQDNEALYKLLLIAQCNELSESLPRMFEKIANWTELLFPGNLLKADSVLGRMVADIPEEDWTDQVQIIGWLYQYYNTELKDDTFAKLKKNVKISKERIPAATQLFTPDWIVRYMVENSLGRIYISDQCAVGSGQSEQERIAQEKAIAEKMGWKYYLPEAEQPPEVRAQLNSLATDHFPLTTLKLIDPCMGSGHILVYAFEVLMQIYEASGYNQRDAAQSILENNLYGLDIDDRAAQLAYFAVMMKARSYDRRIFSRGIQPKIYAIAESNGIRPQTVDYFCNGDEKLRANLTKVMAQMLDAKEYGSILNVTGVDFAALNARFDEIREEIHLLRQSALEELLPMVQCAQLLARKYHVVVTNPPYMGGSGMGNKLSEFVKKNYPDSKSDLFAVFMERCGQMAAKNGYQAMITQHAWMFLSSYEKLRGKLLLTDLVNMTHLGARAFEEIGGEVVQTTSFVLRKNHTARYQGTYCRLIDPTTQQGKEDMFLTGENRYHADQANFSKIPGSPVAYWVSENFFAMFKNQTIGDVAKPRQGLATGCNDIFLRLWFEVNNNKICYNANDIEDAISSRQKWFPYNKGGEFRKWYGNNDYVVNWENNGFLIRNFKNEDGKLRSRPQNTQFYFRQCISWSLISSGTVAFRFKPSGHIFDIAGMSCFAEDNLLYLLALCNSLVTLGVLEVLAPTINFQAGDIANIPVAIDANKIGTVENIVRANIKASQTDWDSCETSWDFKRNPLV